MSIEKQIQSLSDTKQAKPTLTITNKGGCYETMYEDKHGATVLVSLPSLGDAIVRGLEYHKSMATNLGFNLVTRSK